MTDKQLAATKERAHDAISGIYDLVASGEEVPLFDRHAVLSAEQMFLLNEKVDTAEKMAYKAMELSGRMIHSVRRTSLSGGIPKDTADSFKAIAEEFDNMKYAESLSKFLDETKKRLLNVQEQKKEWAQVIENAYLPKEQNSKDLKAIAGYVRSIQLLEDGYTLSLIFISSP